MKLIKCNTSICASLLSLFLSCGASDSSLKSIAKPYLGDYECTQAMLGQEDLLSAYDFITLSLKDDNTYVFKYGKAGEKPQEETGEYSYDLEKGEICLSAGKNNTIKRKFPIKNGTIYISFRMGTRHLIVKFKQK